MARYLQIFVAVVVRSCKDARAAITGLIAQVFLLSAFSPLQNVLTGAGFMWGNRWIGLPWYWHWPYARSLWTVMQGIWIAGDVMLGWLIVRLHRGHGVDDGACLLLCDWRAPHLGSSRSRT
jgi:hypothetical protein